MKKRVIFLVIYSVSFAFIPLQLFAQEKEITLEEVVVTATRDAEEIRKIPANVTVITKEEIVQSHARNTIEVLRDKVDVVVTDFYGNGKSSAVDIRGFGETGPLNTLVLVDGRRVNEIDLSGTDWSQIPLDQVERIEIIRGAGSVLYGDNAVGGVINIITKKPEKSFSATAEVAGGSYGYHRENGSVSGKWGSLSAILNAGYNATGGYRENGFFRAKDVGGKILLDLSENVRFNFSGGFHADNTGLPGGLPEDIYRSHRRATLAPDDHAETNDGYGVLGVMAKLWGLGRIDAELSYRQRQVDDFFVSFNFNDKRELTTWGITPKYILEKRLWKFLNKLTLGLDFYRSDSEVDSESAFGPNRLEVTKQSIGVYVLDEFSILQNLILSLGFRNEWVTFDLFQETPRAKDTARDREPAYNASLDYLFGKRSSAFLSFKRSFRFPVSDELIQFFPVFQVNPFIKPQTGYHYEIGVRHAFTDQIEGNLTLFWIDLQNEIFFNPLTFTNENLSSTRRQGIEVGVKTRPFPWLTLWGNYGYMRPFIRSVPFSGNDIPGVPRHKGSIGSDVRLGWGFLLNAKVNLVGSRRFISDFANQVERLGGYYTLDMKLSYGWKGLKAFVGVNNLLNQKYAEFAVIDGVGNQFFYASPERNFVAGVSYTF